MSINNGIILYTIERDGCLNGVFTHEGLNGKIFNEIARKTDGIESIDGEYANAYFETQGQIVPKDATLQITEKPKGIFRFSWIKGGTEIFYGDGYKMNDRQMAVSYHEGKRP